MADQMQHVLLTLRAYESTVRTLSQLILVMRDMNRRLERMEEQTTDIQTELANVSRSIKEMEQNAPSEMSLEELDAEFHTILQDLADWINYNGPRNPIPAQTTTLHRIHRRFEQLHQVIHTAVEDKKSYAGEERTGLEPGDLDEQGVTDANIIPQTEPVPNPIDVGAGINQENATASTEAEASKA